MIAPEDPKLLTPEETLLCIRRLLATLLEMTTARLSEKQVPVVRSFEVRADARRRRDTPIQDPRLREIAGIICVPDGAQWAGGDGAEHLVAYRTAIIFDHLAEIDAQLHPALKRKPMIS